ncbi:MAG TPA: cell wall-binding repeat-containing protein, partial [Euzebya sp.]|nr:cell wall-binding repeat-containing protein [Euzebya sp.]
MTVRTLRTVWMAGLVLAVVSAGSPAGPQEPDAVRRVGDSADPVVASVLLSQATVPMDGTVEGVVVAREDVFADALAGAALAGSSRPILFTAGGPDAPLRQEVGQEIERLLGGPHGCEGAPQGEVWVLGGEQAVSAEAAAEIEASGYCVRRFAGATRVHTSVQIAREVIARNGGTAGPLLVSRDDDFADAATGGALAARRGLPLVVTPTGSLHPEVAALLAEGTVGAAVLLGGEAALSVEVEVALEEAVGIVGRLAGPSRDGTAAAIAAGPWRHEPVAGVTLVGGFASDGFTYAIAASVLAAQLAAPQLYVQPDALPAPTADVIGGYAQRTGLEVVVVGPDSAVGDAVADQARAVADDPEPLPETLVAFAVDAQDPAERGIWLVEGRDGGDLRRLVDGSVGVHSWTDDGQAIVVPVFDSSLAANGVIRVGLDGSVTPLIDYSPDATGSPFAQNGPAPIHIPNGNAFRSHESPTGQFTRGRFIAVDQLTQAGGQQVREIVVYDTSRRACTGDGCAPLWHLPSPRWRFASDRPWLNSHQLMVIEDGMLVILDLSRPDAAGGRVSIRTGIPATAAIGVEGAIAVSHDGTTRLLVQEFGTFVDAGEPLPIGGGELAVTVGDELGRFGPRLLIEDDNGDVYMDRDPQDSLPPVLVITGTDRQAAGLDAGPLGEEIVVTGTGQGGVRGDIVRPPTGDMSATV